MPETIRLQKLMAQSGIASRRTCEEMIKQGSVAIDGIAVTELGTKVDPQKQIITVNGKIIKVPKKFTYIMINKPKGFVTTLADELGRPTVADLAPVKALVKPVGRLDIDTAGLLVMTDDGELINKLTHPRYGISKTYRATIRGHISDKEIATLEKGIFIEGRRTAPARVKVIARNDTRSMVEITIKEGRKRQVRLMMATVDHPVKELKRVRFGPLRITGLAKGAWRHLTPEEVKALQYSWQKTR